MFLYQIGKPINKPCDPLGFAIQSLRPLVQAWASTYRLTPEEENNNNDIQDYGVIVL